ncbi:MAG: TolC family outer membrane protein [Magnetococcales bacterium]|nr:TolC family outer membrane protein [Magnetococcales bacterium]
MNSLRSFQSMVFSGCLGLALVMVSSWASATSFHDVLDTTLERNPKVRAASQRLKSAQERDPQSQAALLPTVTLSAGISHSDTEWSTGDSSSTPSEISLGLTQTLFNKQAFTAYAQSEPYIRTFEKDLDAARQGVIFEAIEAALKVMEAEEVAELSKNNEKLIERHLSATKARYQVGEITRTNVSQAVSRLSSATADRIKAENGISSTLARFLEVTGVVPPEQMTVPEPANDITGLSHDALFERLSSRPDLQAASLRVRVAEMTARIKHEAHYPTVSLSGELSRGWNSASGLGDPVDGMSVALTASLPLFSGGMVQSQTREAWADHKAQVADLSRIQRQAQREVAQAQLDFQSSEATVKAYESVVAAGQAALDGVEQEFQVGTRTALEVLDAQYELFSAQTQLTQNRYARLLARYRLLYAVGMLDQSVINQ